MYDMSVSFIKYSAVISNITHGWNYCLSSMWILSQ